MWRIFLRSEVWILPTRAYGAGSSKLGAPIARNLRHTRPIPNGYWHLDERVLASSYPEQKLFALLMHRLCPT